MNAEFPRIARRDKKAFLSDQCKEIEENNRMGKTRDLFKKQECDRFKWTERCESVSHSQGMPLIDASGCNVENMQWKQRGTILSFERVRN